MKDKEITIYLVIKMNWSNKYKIKPRNNHHEE